MSGSVNKAILIGNVGRDPEIRNTGSGRVASLALATSESWQDKGSGERKEKTEWHRISCFNDNVIAVIERYVRKGSRLYIEGEINTRKWQDQSGQDRYTTEIVIGRFRGELKLLGEPGVEGEERDVAQATRSETTAPQRPAATRPGARHQAPVQKSLEDDLDDAIPF